MKTKKGEDAYGYKRDFKGHAGKDDAEFMRSYDKAADKFMYGPKAVGMTRKR